MLAFVIPPPFGNTIFEATIPLSVTIIMSQFGLLTLKGEFDTIPLTYYDYKM